MQNVNEKKGLWRIFTKSICFPDLASERQNRLYKQTCANGLFFWFRDRIIAVSTQRMAAANAMHGKVTAFYAAMFVQGFHCVCTAGGLIPAIEANPRAKHQPVSANGKGEYEGQRAHVASRFDDTLWCCSFDKAVRRSANKS